MPKKSRCEAGAATQPGSPVCPTLAMVLPVGSTALTSLPVLSNSIDVCEGLCQELEEEGAPAKSPDTLGLALGWVTT